MATEVELDSLDLRYEGFRLKAPAVEARLLGSIAQRGLEEPLEGVDLPAADRQAGVQGRGVLLNGFKRYRCARKLRLATVPYTSLGQDEAAAILDLLRGAKERALSILEQAAFIDELKRTQSWSVAEMAAELGRSKAWVSVRLGLIGQMSPAVRRQVFAGAFPVYSFIYTLRPFMRLNGPDAQDAASIEEFVAAVSGHGLSVREIEQLAQGFFRGPESFRAEIRQGHLNLPLQRLREAPPHPDGCNEFERVLLGELELLQKHMQRVMGKSLDPRLQSRPFHAQCHLLTTSILSRARAFFHILRQLHDRNGQA